VDAALGAVGSVPLVAPLDALTALTGTLSPST
jgi:hypothetical protein